MMRLLWHIVENVLFLAAVVVLSCFALGLGVLMAAVVGLALEGLPLIRY